MSHQSVDSLLVKSLTVSLKSHEATSTRDAKHVSCHCRAPFIQWLRFMHHLKVQVLFSVVQHGRLFRLQLAGHTSIMCVRPFFANVVAIGDGVGCMQLPA
jgi:hypothetical protein